MKFGSVCSGIEAASVAWDCLGWQADWFAEIEPFPSAILAHHYPSIPNLGDMTTLPNRILSSEVEAPDILCGGTPCQAFSVAGNRQSLDDGRGNLTLTFCEIADAIDKTRINNGQQPSIIFWENVPGVLNTKDNAFGCFLGKLAGEDMPLQPAGKRWTNAGVVSGPKRTIAWRVLDAQYFGLAQRRKRVFVVASARDTFDPTAVLFEFDGVRRDSAPSRKARKDITELVGTLAANGGGLNRPAGNCNELDFCVTTSFKVRGGCEGGGKGYLGQDEQAFTISCHQDQHIYHKMAVRRLTPTECERLQGFPDGYTAIPWRKKPAEECPDGSRYKALGNSWAVPVVRWIGQRIKNEILNQKTGSVE